MTGEWQEEPEVLSKVGLEQLVTSFADHPKHDDASMLSNPVLAT
jgi:hypothetical protein